MDADAALAVSLLLSRSFVGAAFMIAGAQKLKNLPGFTRTLEDYPLGSRLKRTIGTTLPPFEVLLGLAMAVGLLLPLTAAVAASLLVAFTAAAVGTHREQNRFDCGCFGVIGNTTTVKSLLLRNGFLAAAAFLVAGTSSMHLSFADRMVGVFSAGAAIIVLWSIGLVKQRAVRSSEIPRDLTYSPSHNWLRWENGLVRVGMTAHAQAQLGEVVYVELPEPSTLVGAKSKLGEVESVKVLWEIFSPVEGEVVESNAVLDEVPDLVNRDPYGQGWLVMIRPVDPEGAYELLSASEYENLVARATKPS